MLHPRFEMDSVIQNVETTHPVERVNRAVELDNTGARKNTVAGKQAE